MIVMMIMVMFIVIMLMPEVDDDQGLRVFRGEFFQILQTTSLNLCGPVRQILRLNAGNFPSFMALIY